MLRAPCLIVSLFFSIPLVAQKQVSPEQLYGQLFQDVQLSGLYPDSKTFADAIPKRPAQIILADYLQHKPAKAELRKFVEDNFEFPKNPQLNYITREKDILQHIRNTWAILRRNPEPARAGESRIGLPFPYLVPGGRFTELNYGDAYFALLGLRESNNYELMEQVISNFAWLVDSFGYIPASNRTYSLGRSNAPFFSLMVELLAQTRGDSIYVHYLPQLEKEYRYWMQGADKLKPGQAVAHVVRLKDGSLLNRYWAENTGPRADQYKEDLELADKSNRPKPDFYRNLRATAESGMDFSVRWLKEASLPVTLQTTELIAVDLNCLLYKLEAVIARGYLINKADSLSATFRKKADARRKAIDKFCWNKSLKYYTDYNFKLRQSTGLITVAGLYPFCFFQGRPDYLSLLARQAARQVKEQLLKPGGVISNADSSKWQWDAPNGWAPMQWMAVWGLDRCGQRELAREIGQRWIKLNFDYYARNSKLMDKYNVIDTSQEAQTGPYPNQEGFGCTNGTLLALVKKYGRPAN